MVQVVHAIRWIQRAAGRDRQRSVMLSLLAMALVMTAALTAEAQAPQGATLTVTGGTVAVITARGAVQPAGSGMSLAVGDQIATVGKSSALVTFFEGSELELGSDTTIILREIQTSGNREVHIIIEDVLGTTVNRVQAFVNPNSSYQVQTPGGKVVALIRGSVVGFTQFESGGTLVKADCKRACEVYYQQGKVCEGNLFACGVDAKGNVTNDPNFQGELIDRDGGSQSDSDEDNEGGTIGG